MAKRLLLVLMAACGGAAKAPPAQLQISEQGVGALTAQTLATVDGVRAAFPGYDVKRVDTPDGPEIHVARGPDDLLYIVPQLRGTSILNVHVTSAHVLWGEHGWQIGAAFKGGTDAITNCECWGPRRDRPGHNVCYRKGEHVAIGFERECRDETEELPAILADVAGKPIKLVVWSPSPFGEKSNAPVKDETP
ncbi:MAG TPA: hypothetical protein VGM88_00030 [Kofleriaceae bacterium]|jgi:hypothetical protein